MWIQSITISKNLELGTSKEIPISFQKINVTSLSTTSIPASYGKSGATKQNNGTANTTKVNAGNSSSSTQFNGGAKGPAREPINSGKSSILFGVGKSLGIFK